MTSSPGSRMAFRMTLQAPAAADRHADVSAEKSRPVSRPAARPWPRAPREIRRWACSRGKPGGSSSTTRRRAAMTAWRRLHLGIAEGEIEDIVRAALSASRAPSSNMRRIHDERSSCSGDGPGDRHQSVLRGLDVARQHVDAGGLQRSMAASGSVEAEDQHGLVLVPEGKGVHVLDVDAGEPSRAVEHLGQPARLGPPPRRPAPRSP